MIHHVFANKSNIGDWLSARGIQSLLAPYEVTEHFCDGPFVPQTLERLVALSEDDFIVIGGGGLFMDYFVPFWEGFRAIAGRVPFCIWGVGYCDMKREDSRPPQALLEEIVRASKLCIVRDALTRDCLRACDIPPPVGCPTMCVVESRPLGHGLLHVDAYDNVGHDVYETMDNLGQEFAAATGRTFRALNNLIPAGSERALEATLAQYASADLILTGRLHGCIVGLAMGRKVLAVSGDRKVESFMRAAGLGDWVLETNEIAALSGRLHDLPQQKTPSEFITGVRGANVAVADQVKSLIAKKQIET